VAAVFVHGFPETSRIWDSLRGILGRDSIALALPGFGSPRPARFTAMKDAYAEWLADELQTPGIGEESLKSMREADPEDPNSTAARLAGAGMPIDEAKAIGAAHDETMSRSILDFYRSAVPNVGVDWWNDVKAQTRSRGLVLLLPDPPEEEEMSLEVAQRLGAQTARLDDLNHCWMAEAPETVAPVLQRFWSSFD
jgi:hypothetical protein